MTTSRLTTVLATVACLLLLGAPTASASTLTAPGRTYTPGLRIDPDQASYAPGAPVHVSYSGWPGGSGEYWVDPASKPADATTPASNFQFFGGPSGTYDFGTLPAGNYQVRAAYLNSSPAQIVAVQDFSVGTSKSSSPSSPHGSASERAAATRGSVSARRPSFKAGRPVGFRWTGFASTDSIQFWFVPKGAPLSIVPSGPYFTGSGPSGSHVLPSPGGSGRYEIRFFNLHVSPPTPRRGGSFTVGSAHISGVANGHYGCYTSGTGGSLIRSSIGAITIANAHYTALGRRGTFLLNKAKATMKLTSGPLKGRLAHYTERPARSISFRPQENQKHGRSTVDASTTVCSYGRR